MKTIPLYYLLLGLLITGISGCESSSSSDGSATTGGSADSDNPDNNTQALSLLQIASQPVSSDASPLDIQRLSDSLRQIDNDGTDLEPVIINSDDSVVSVLNRARAN